MKLKQIVSWTLIVVLLIGFCNVFAASPSDCYVKSAAGKMPATAPTVDGTVNASEWGDPIIVTSPEHASATWAKGYVKDNPAQSSNSQRAKVWLTNDKDYIYVAGTLDHEQTPGQWSDSGNSKSPMMKVMLGAKGADGLNTFSNGMEQRVLIMMKYDSTGKMALFAKRSGETARENIESQVTAKYRFDAASGVYHYEMRIPYSATNIDITKTGEIAMAVMLGGSTPAGGKNNHYCIGGYADQRGAKYDVAATSQPQMYDVNNGPFYVGMTLNTAFDCYIKSAAGLMPATAPTVDGTVNASEWGDPIIVTSPEHASATWAKGYVKDNPAQSSNSQRAKVWLTNDKDYIYVAGTLDHEQTPGQWSDSGNSKSPMMKVMLGAKGADGLNTFSNGMEQRVLIMMKYDSTGKMALFAKRSGETARENIESQVTAKYRFDAASGVYHYEMRIPYSATNIDITKTGEIAMAVMLGGSTPAGGKNNHYCIGGYADQRGAKYDVAATSQPQMYDVNNGPFYVGMTLNTGFDCYSTNVAGKMPDVEPVLDGLVSTEEWGEPIIVTSPEDAANQWNGGYWKNEAYDDTQRAKIWLTNDRGYIYVAVTVDKETMGEAWFSTTSSWAYPMLRLMLAARGQNTDLVQVNNNGTVYEQRTLFTFRFDESGNPVCRVDGRQLSVANTLDGSNWSMNYDVQNESYTYELRIPYNMTNIDPTKSTEIAMGVQIGASNHWTHEKKENNRYNIGGTGVADDTSKATTPYQGKCLRLTINDLGMEGYTKDAVSSFSGNIAIDGKIGDAEWGDPIAATYPTHCKSNGNVFWTHHKASLELGQQVKIYATNDAENLYFAATIDRTDYDTSDKDAYARAHFMITFGRYDEQTDLERVVSRGKTYERFTLIVMSFDKSGNPYFRAVGRGFDRVVESDCDYVIAYDADSRTYTYEVRIPISSTTLSYGNNNEMTACFTVSPAYVGNNEANRYNIGGTGTARGNAKADNFAHTGHSIRLALNENNYSQMKNEMSVEGVNLEYITYYVSNPESGDMPIGWFIGGVVFALIGIVVVTYVRKRELFVK